MRGTDIIRRQAGNLAALGVTLLFFYFAIGSLFLRFGPGVLPSLPNMFPIAATIWWQSSAPDPAHHDYVALLGDSYAEGAGDWLAARTRIAEPYGSADIIHQRTGLNVLSFGVGGSGSAEGFVLYPTWALNADYCLIFPAPRRPTAAIYYFYEGNDLNDNIGFIRTKLHLTPEATGIEEASMHYFAETMGKMHLATCIKYFRDSVNNMIHVAFMSIAHPPQTAWRGMGTTRVMVGGAIVSIPGGLEAPSLELDGRSTDAALEVFEAAMTWFIDKYPDIKFTVVDVPSVLTNYRLIDSSVITETYQYGNPVQPTAQIAPRSDAICEHLQAITLAHGQKFLDARPAIREAASHDLIHGPLNWAHFNRIGYTRLGETVAAALSGDNTFASCAHLAAD
jgi:hypothetical protein